MGTTQPIRDTEDLNRLKNYYLKEQPNLRNYALICTGINTALRISDILNLKWDDVYHFETDTFHRHLIVKEHKTGKINTIVLNQSIVSVLSLYKNSLKEVAPQDFIFSGKCRDTHLSRSQAYRIIRQACENLRFPEHISCHSLRKTFGYHAWVSGVNPATLMVIYNHSSFQITKRYLGIEQDDKDRIFLDLNL